MAITTLDGLIAAPLQNVTYLKTASPTAIAATAFSNFAQAGNPGAGTLAVGNTTAGVVPTDATAGYPVINAFGGGATGYLAKVGYSNTVASRITLYDTVFSAGAFAFNQNAALTAPPSYSSRVPGGTDYTNTELWLEAVTAFTGNLSINVGYTNQAGTSGRSTGTIATGVAPTVARYIQLPLQAGDSGIQSISGTITATVSTAGTFNLHVLRRLWTGRIPIANGAGTDDWQATGLPILFADSALRMIVVADTGTSLGLPELHLDIRNG